MSDKAMIKSEWIKVTEEMPPEDLFVLVYGDEGKDMARWDTFLDGWMRRETAEYDNDGARVSGVSHWAIIKGPE